MNFLEKLKPITLLLLRCVLGIIFITHGYPKLFAAPGDANRVVLRPNPSLVYLAGTVELFGGGLLIVGLFTRAAALLLAVDMGLTVWNLGPASGYLGGYLGSRAHELPLVLCVASLALASVGPGIISIDQPLFASPPKRKPAKK